MDSEKRLRHELAELNLLLRGLAQVPAFPAELLELISGKVDSMTRLIFTAEEPLSTDEQIHLSDSNDDAVPVSRAIDQLEQQRYTDLSRTLTLNDRFRFQRAFFENDPHQMSEAFSVINKKQSVEEALTYLRSVCRLDEDSDSFQDFRQMLNLHFTGVSNNSQSH